jgi:hypothetical protein
MAMEAQKGSRSITPQLHNFSARYGLVFNTTPQPLYHHTQKKNCYALYGRPGGTQGRFKRVWTTKSLGLHQGSNPGPSIL